MKKFLMVLMGFPVISLLAACGGGGSDGGSTNNTDTGTYTENTLTLSELVAPQQSSPDAGSALSRKISPPVDCTFIADIYSSTGTCITPSNVLGYAEQAHLQKDNGIVGGGTRILGQSEYDEPPGAIFYGAAFDLSTPGELLTNNTLSEQFDAREQYDTLTISTAWYKVQFPLVISSGTKVVTMLLAKYGQPFASSSAVTNAIGNCGLTTEEAGYSRYQDADILTDLSFNRGDYLFCIKDTEADLCAAADYQWLDTANNTLVSTRPGVPKTSHWLANTPIECSSDGGGAVNFDFGPFGFYATIDAVDQFKLWSDFSHASLSKQWALASEPLDDETISADPSVAWVSPYYIYYYQDCGSGTCTTTQEGSNLDVDLVFDTTDMILVDGLDPDAIAAMDNIGDALLKVHVKSQWAFDQKSINSIVGYDAIDMAGASVKPTITLTGAANEPPADAFTFCADIDVGTAPDGICSDPGSSKGAD